MNTQSSDPSLPVNGPIPLPAPATTTASRTSRSTDWYAEGDSRAVQVGDLRIVVRFLGTKGRRARVQIEAPAGAEFLER